MMSGFRTLFSGKAIINILNDGDSFMMGIRFLFFDIEFEYVQYVFCFLKTSGFVIYDIEQHIQPLKTRLPVTSQRGSRQKISWMSLPN